MFLGASTSPINSGVSVRIKTGNLAGGFSGAFASSPEEFILTFHSFEMVVPLAVAVTSTS